MKQSPAGYPVSLIGLLLVGIFLAQVFPVGGAEPKLEDRLLFLAESAFRQGNFPEVKQNVVRILKLNPRHAGGLYYKAVLLEQSQQEGKAGELYRKIIRDKQFGSMARDHLFALASRQRQKGQNNAIQSYIEGGAFAEALQECRKALNQGRRDEELLLQAIFSAAMVGDLRYSESALTTLNSTGSASEELRQNVRLFVDGWKGRQSTPRDAVERLMGITEPRLMTWHTRQEIRRLLLELSLFQEYEEYLQAERRKPGVDRNAIEQDLVRFYTDQGLYEKGLTLLRERPIESLVDNLLYLELLTRTGEEEKTLSLARDLVLVHPDEEAFHEAWIKAYLHYNDRTGKAPTGRDSSGLKFQDIAMQEVERVLKGPAEGEKARRLLVGSQLAAILGEDTFLKGLVDRVTQIRFDDSLASETLLTCEALNNNGARHFSTRILESALSQRPDDPNVQQTLAENYFLDNRSNDAIPLLEGVVSHDPERLRAFLLLLDSLASAGRVKEAHEKALAKLNEPNLPDLIVGQVKSRAIVLAGKVQAGPDAAGGGNPDSASAPVWPAEPEKVQGSESIPVTGSGKK